MCNPAHNDTDDETKHFPTEMLHNGNKPRFVERRQTYDGIVPNGGARVVNEKTLPPEAIVIGIRYVYCMLKSGIEAEQFQALNILLAHRDKSSHKIANDSPELMELIEIVVLYLSLIYFKI